MVSQHVFTTYSWMGGCLVPLRSFDDMHNSFDSFTSIRGTYPDLIFSFSNFTFVRVVLISSSSCEEEISTIGSLSCVFQMISMWSLFAGSYIKIVNSASSIKPASRFHV